MQDFINGLDPILKSLLNARGIKNSAEIYDFLFQDIYSLSNPFEISGINHFIERVKEAAEQNEKVLIYGDKDADGITAAAIAYSTLSKICKYVEAYVPTLESGYGLNKEVLDGYLQSGVSLVITCDCGISNVEEVAYLKELGVDTIVSDHHDLPAELPDAYAIFNPKIEACGFSDKNFCGAGVIFKLMQGLVLSHSEYYNSDFVILDFQANGSLSYVRAMRVRNFHIDKENVLDLENKGQHFIVCADEEMKIGIEDALDTLSEFLFENEDCYVVCTGGKKRFDKILAIYAEHNVYPPPVKDVFDLIGIAQKLIPLSKDATKSLDKFAAACGVNVYEDAEHKHHDLILRAKCFSRLFLQSRSKIVKHFESKIALAALGTLADIVPLTGENRSIVREGIKSIAAESSVGVKALLNESRADKSSLTTNVITWRLTPIINAAGRMGKPDDALRLLYCEDETEAAELAALIFGHNEKRKDLTTQNYNTVKELLESEDAIQTENLIIVKSANIEQGLTGLIAGRLQNAYKLPVIVVYENEELNLCVGSARSAGNDNVRMLVESASDLLLKFGGHKNASGFSLNAENYDEFCKLCIENSQKMRLGEEDADGIDYDAKIQIKEVSHKLAEQLELLEPFGEMNEEPVFLSEGVEFSKLKRIGKKNDHILLSVSQDGSSADALMWSPGEELIEKIESEGKAQSISYKIQMNRFNGSESPRIMIENIVIGK